MTGGATLGRARSGAWPRRGGRPIRWQSRRQLAGRQGRRGSRPQSPGVSWPPTSRVDRALAVPDELLGQGTEAREAAAHAEGDVFELLREDERCGERARIAELGGHDVAAAGLAVADRDLLSRFEEIELEQLGRAVERALVGAVAPVERPELAHVVIQDRLPALVAEVLDQLADALGRGPRVLLQEALDLVAEAVELRGPWRALVARGLVAAQRAADGVAVVAGAPDDLVDREPVDELHPPDLRPALHLEHCLPPRQSHDSARLGFAPDETAYPSTGCDFNRPRRVIIRAAPTPVKRAAPRPALRLGRDALRCAIEHHRQHFRGGQGPPELRRPRGDGLASLTGREAERRPNREAILDRRPYGWSGQDCFDQAAGGPNAAAPSTPS